MSEESLSDADRQSREASGFLTATDDAGRVVGFHSLRHSFISNLARAGVHPKQAQDLARHSDINLTLSRYTHTVLGDRANAVEALPDLDEEESDGEQNRATGTDGHCLPTGLPNCLPRRVVLRRIDSRPSAPNNPRKDAIPRSENTTKTVGSRTSTHRRASTGIGVQRLRPAGLEPTTPGLGNRCSIHLSYGRRCFLPLVSHYTAVCYEIL